MLTSKTLSSLASVHHKEANCISIYVNYSSLQNLQKIVKSHLRLTEIDISTQTKKHILSTNRTKGAIAIFHSSPNNIKFVDLKISIEDSYYRGNVYNLFPLYRYVASRPRFSLVIINNNKAVLYDFNNEELFEIVSIFKEEKDYKNNAGYYTLSVGASGGITDKKSKYGSLEYEYYSLISKDLLKYNRNKNIKYSVVSSSVNLESNIRDLFKTDYFNTIFVQNSSKISENEIAENSLKLINKNMTGLNRKNIEKTIELNYPINKLALNFSEVLQSINEKKIATLFIKNKFKQEEGYQCPKCGYFSIENNSLCAYCKSEMVYSNNISLNVLNNCIKNQTDIVIYYKDLPIINKKDIFALKKY